jgi:hypothetical protein
MAVQLMAVTVMTALVLTGSAFAQENGEEDTEAEGTGSRRSSLPSGTRTTSIR